MEGNRSNITEEDVARPSISLVIILLFTAFVGISVNTFIVAVNCTDWVRRKRLSTIDQILTILGFTRFSLSCIAVVDSFRQPFHSWPYGFIDKTFSILNWFLNVLNLWFGVCLGIFYCVKIANFSHHFCISLKLKISRLMPWLLMASVLLAIFNTFPAVTFIFKTQFKKSNSSIPENNKGEDIPQIIYFLHLFSLFVVGFPLCFTILCISTFLLLLSLWRHTRQLNSSSNNNPSMHAHILAVKIIMSFFIIHVIHFSAWLIVLAASIPNRKLQRLFLFQIANSCPLTHSVLLILSYPKLKQALTRILHYMGCAKGVS